MNGFVRGVHQAGQPGAQVGFWIRAARRALTVECDGLGLHGACGTISSVGYGLRATMAVHRLASAISVDHIHSHLRP